MNDSSPNDNTTQITESTNTKTTKSKTTTIPGKPRGATYDGNICMICSDRASGFHYGVLACEGCKGFFKRVCKEKLNSLESNDAGIINLQTKRHCVFGGNCEINVRTRNRCQYCRIQKCIDLGMSKDGIKLGRRSKKFKQNLNQVVSKKPDESIHTTETNSDLYKQQIIAILQDNKLVIKAIDILSAAAAATANNNSQNSVFLLSPGTSSNSQSSSLLSSLPVNPLVLLNSKFLNNLESVVENVSQAYKDTKHIYSNNIESFNFLQDNFINNNLDEILTNQFNEGLVSFLKKSKFLDQINLFIENTVLFAKNVPLFMNINETDRISLLKSSVFSVICIRHLIFYKYSNNMSSLATLADCALAYNFNNFHHDINLADAKFYLPFLNCWLTCDWICEKFTEIKKFIHLLFEFYFYFNSFGLNETELAIFCSFILFDSDDPNLGDNEVINNYRNLYQELLVRQLEKRQSEKDQNKVLTKEFFSVWLINCCKKLKDLNLEHTNILNSVKESVQFPDLYAELYNL
ncbi:unnamed protein product [Brachionus calyciflorus]|uniref:Nuclear receptor n=1 Tax=Brachionus calyciflorus TaxID=104777 RepID=A0A813UT48_9BILA|nr:unnamed protein product [Brachionus calyciflorus]